MATFKTKIMFNPGDCTYDLAMKIGQHEIIVTKKPEVLFQEIYHQVAVKIAAKIVERLAPALDKALEEMKIESEEQ